MVGQGSPLPPSTGDKSPVASLIFWLCTIATWLSLSSLGWTQSQEMNLRLRIEWGGGRSKQWAGTIGVSQGKVSNLQHLGIQPDEMAAVTLSSGNLRIHSVRPTVTNAIDCSITAPNDAKLLIRLGDSQTSNTNTPLIEIPVQELINVPFEQQLDQWQNSIRIRRAPGDQLRVQVNRRHLIFTPGERLACQIQPHFLNVKPGTRVDFDFQLQQTLGGNRVIQLDSQTRTIPGDFGSPEPLQIETNLPEVEGVYELAVTASTNRLRLGGFGRRWFRDVLMTRRVQLVVLNTRISKQPEFDEAVTVQEIDPSQPNWWQRIGTFPLPSLNRYVPLPKPLRSASEPSRHSQQDDETIQQESETGLMTLKAVGTDGKTPWQGFPLTVKKLGQPHLLEVEYLNAPQTLGISVLDPHANGHFPALGIDSGVHVHRSTLLVPPKTGSKESDKESTSPQLKTHRLIFGHGQTTRY